MRSRAREEVLSKKRADLGVLRVKIDGLKKLQLEARQTHSQDGAELDRATISSLLDRRTEEAAVLTSEVCRLENEDAAAKRTNSRQTSAQ